MADHYETLGVPRSASPADIKAAFRRKASAHHPDKNGGDGASMAVVNKAYATLGDTERRATYDATGYDGQPPSAEDKAKEMLRQLLLAAINAPVGENCIRWAQEKLREVREDTERMIRQQQADADQLRQRRAAVSVKGGENILHNIIDQQLDEIEQRSVAFSEHLQLTAQVTTMLDAYESAEVAIPARDPFADIFSRADRMTSAYGRNYR